MLKKFSMAGALIAAAVAALPAGMPMAYADSQAGGQQCPSQQGAEGQSADQQCQQQKGPGMPDRPINNRQQQQQDPNEKPISQVGFMYLVNGVPTCFHNWDVGVPGMIAINPVQAS